MTLKARVKRLEDKAPRPKAALKLRFVYGAPSDNPRWRRMRFDYGHGPAAPPKGEGADDPQRDTHTEGEDEKES